MTKKAKKKLLQLNNNTASNKNKSEFIATSFRVDKWKQNVPTKFEWMDERTTERDWECESKPIVMNRMDGTQWQKSNE